MIDKTSRDGLAPGFRSPVPDAQQTFRRLMDAFARPGTIVDLAAELAPPTSLMPAAAAVLLTLADLDTPVWLDPRLGGEAAGYLAFHCGCAFVEPLDQATFGVLVDGTDVRCLDGFAVGDADFPDRSATVVIQVDGLRADGGVRLNGPGIDGQAMLQVDGLDARFWTFQAGNRMLFPLGIDVVFASGRQLAALPRGIAAMAG